MEERAEAGVNQINCVPQSPQVHKGVTTPPVDRTTTAGDPPSEGRKHEDTRAEDDSSEIAQKETLHAKGHDRGCATNL